MLVCECVCTCACMCTCMYVRTCNNFLPTSCHMCIYCVCVCMCVCESVCVRDTVGCAMQTRHTTTHTNTLEQSVLGKELWTILSSSPTAACMKHNRGIAVCMTHTLCVSIYIRITNSRPVYHKSLPCMH